MPGFNRRGPENQGPMTGRGRGLCTGAADPVQGFGTGYGPGFGRGRGRRWCQGGFGPRGPMRPWQAAPDTGNNDLEARAKWLETELAAVKQQLNDLS
ncbi:MAG: DUF5320 domain-containing protein [Desulfotignum sp.]|nr:DUF5320 domain-containing protein [Desulfotignum sp.]